MASNKMEIKGGFVAVTAVCSSEIGETFPDKTDSS